VKKYIPLRSSYFSFLLDKKVIMLYLTLLLISGVLLIVSIGVGQMYISPKDTVKALFGFGDEMQNLVVQSLRLPRILLAFLAGMALAVSGAILQGIIRNPLASPDYIGITSGAAFATVGFFAIFSDRSNSLSVSIHWLPLAACIGALSVGLFIYFLSWKKGVSPIRLILIGIGLEAVTGALRDLMILMGPIFLASRAHIWITGSVNGANWKEVVVLLPMLAVLLFIAFVYVRKVNVQELGEEMATNLGSHVQKERFVLLVLSTSLAGGAVAFAGGIGFVGLMAPHIGRKLVGSAFGGLLPVSALIGGIIVVVADLIARTAFAPLEIPAGVFTSAIGAPYFIYLLYKNRKK
jgi:iron complex transport system permease protein